MEICITVWFDCTEKNNYSAQKIIKLNSSNASGNWLTKGVATHEFCHAWGLNDCNNKSSIECGYDDTREINYANSDVTDLF